VNTSAELVALVPPVVVTVTSTGPVLDAAGDVAVIDVSLLTVKDAGVEPKFTALAPVRSVPVIVTDVPPVVVPVVGVMPVTVGAAGSVVKLNVAPGYQVPSTSDHAVKKYVVLGVIGRRPAGIVAEESCAEKAVLEATAGSAPVE